MRKILLATAAAAFALSGVTMAAPASAEPSKPTPGTASPMHASCGRAGPNLENRVDADAPASDFTGAIAQVKASLLPSALSRP